MFYTSSYDILVFVMAGRNLNELSGKIMET